MSKQKGFDDWIPVFRGGKQIASNGKEYDGDTLIDTAIAKFNAAVHEPPAVIGHPKEDAPAYGWVEGLKKQGNLLLAKFKQVQPAFAQMVADGLFKKRSAAFYPDGTLRHVGFLGAMPPAVKGLPDVAFAEGDAACFAFADYETYWAWQDIARLYGKIRDYLIEKEGVEKADQIIAPYEIESITAAAIQEKQEAKSENNYGEKEDKDMTFKEKLAELFKDFVAKLPDEKQVAAADGQFSEADLDKIKKEAAEEAAKKEREKVTAEFAEASRVSRLTARKADITAWAERMIKEGKLTPAMVKFGIPEMLAAFAEKEDVIEFGEAKDKATLFDRFKNLFETEMPKVIIFKEVAQRDKTVGDAGTKLEALTREKMKANDKLTYGAAFAEVQKENLELAAEYAQEIKGEK
jgi:hypothetical protein